MTDDHVLTRLYRVLVDELERRDHDWDRPLQVSELYEDVVPYRLVRGALDVPLNADYGHVLLRLLAGEEDLVRLEPESARRELAEELSQPYPNVEAYRDHAGARVWVTPPVEEAAPEPGAPSEPEAAPPEPEASSEPEVTPPEPEASSEPEVTPPEPEASPEPHSHPPCAHCGGELPPGREVRFCPHCGADQRLQPCPDCGELLEPGWRFCIGCGREVESG